MNVPTKPFDEAEKTSKTGDIILFHGSSVEREVIEIVDHSVFSHVGMVVDGNLFGRSRPLFWESSTITDFVDIVDHKKHAGVHLIDLKRLL